MLFTGQDTGTQGRKSSTESITNLRSLYIVPTAMSVNIPIKHYLLYRGEETDIMRHTKLHSTRDTDEEGTFLRSGHLESGVHHVHAACWQAAI